MNYQASILIVSSIALAGCASQSPTEKFAGDSAAVLGGGAVAYELSDKNPVVAAAGAVGALAVKTSLDAAAEKKLNKQVKTAYQQGLAQGLKTNYWAHQDDQARDTTPASDGPASDYLPINVPERKVNGVIEKPVVEYIRVDGQQ
jgi:hypothetical protein